MDDGFRFADELGPLKLVHIWRPGLGLKAVVAIDKSPAAPRSAACGWRPMSARGGFRLARAMTLKNAAAGLPHGGGKSVIFGDPRMPVRDKEPLIRAFAGGDRRSRRLHPRPRHGYQRAGMGWINDEIGRAVGLPREIGGIPLDEIGATGLGWPSAIEGAPRPIWLEPPGRAGRDPGLRRGRQARRALSRRKRGGIGRRQRQPRNARRRQRPRRCRVDRAEGDGRPLQTIRQGRKLDGDAIVDVACDIWIPAARPDVHRCRQCRSAGHQDGRPGREYPVHAGGGGSVCGRGVLVLPDFIANAGGVICAAVEYRWRLAI